MPLIRRIIASGNLENNVGLRERDARMDVKPSYSWDAISENEDYSESDDSDFTDDSEQDEEEEDSGENDTDTEEY